MATVKINSNNVTFIQRKKAEAARKRIMARRRFVTCVTAIALLVTGFLTYTAKRDRDLEPKMRSIVEMTRERADYAAQVNGWDVYVVPSK